MVAFAKLQQRGGGAFVAIAPKAVRAVVPHVIDAGASLVLVDDSEPIEVVGVVEQVVKELCRADADLLEDWGIA